MKYSYLKSIIKVIKYTVLILLGLVIKGMEVQAPEIFGLTIGASLIFVYDWLKHRWGLPLF